MNHVFHPSRAGSLTLNAMGVASSQDMSALAHSVRPTLARTQAGAAQRRFLFEGALARAQAWFLSLPLAAGRRGGTDPHPSV